MNDKLLVKVLKQILVNQILGLRRPDCSGALDPVSTAHDTSCELVSKIDAKLDENTGKSEVPWHKGDIAEVREGWDRAGTRFTVLGPAIFLEQWWVPVEDPDEEDPDFHKEAGLRKVVKDEDNS